MDDLQRIPLDAIAIRDRLRAVDPDHVAHIAASIAQIGQQTPILVAPAGADGKHQVLAGAHRLEALRLVGDDYALALVVDVDALDERLIEIDENLMRRELSELDRAVFLAERKAIYEQRHPEARNGRAPKPRGRYAEKTVIQAHLPHGVPGFHRDAAKKLGISPDHIRKLLARARIEPDQRARLAGSRWADHGPTLDAIARYEDPKLRRAVVDALTREDGPARSLAAAEEEVFGPRNHDEAEEQFARLMTSWRKAGAAARRRFEEFLRRERDDALTETLKAAHGRRGAPEADDA